MKNSQKGFAVPFLTTIIVILIVSFGVYLYSQSKRSQPITPESTISTSTPPSESDLNKSLSISTTTSTNVPVTINIDLCDNNSPGYCFGSGGQPSNKTMKDVTLWYRISTDTMYVIGIQTTNTNGNDKFYGVDIDFSNHIYTNKETNEMENVVLSLFADKKIKL